MNRYKKKWSLDRQKFLSEAEIKKLRRMASDKALADLQKGRTTWPRFWMIIDLATKTGMRVSEIANLKVGNLHLNSREPRILVTGKGQKTRDVFISKELMNHLLEFIRWKEMVEEPIGERDYLLQSSHRRPFCVSTLQYCFKVC